MCNLEVALLNSLFQTFYLSIKTVVERIVVVLDGLEL